MCSQQVRERFLAAPPGEARRIARYACGRGTERVGVLAGFGGTDRGGG